MIDGLMLGEVVWGCGMRSPAGRESIDWLTGGWEYIRREKVDGRTGEVKKAKDFALDEWILFSIFILQLAHRSSDGKSERLLTGPPPLGENSDQT